MPLPNLTLKLCHLMRTNSVAMARINWKYSYQPMETVLIMMLIVMCVRVSGKV